MPTEKEKIAAAMLQQSIRNVSDIIDIGTPPEVLVKALGEKIGFGYLMQLSEKLWGDILEAQCLPRGGARAAYCCSTFLVPCPACPPGEAHKCDWCCGAGRVTKKVAEAIRLNAEAP